MPVLSSNRKIAISFELIEDVEADPISYLYRLDSIRKLEDLYQFLGIVEFIKPTGAEAINVHFVEGSKYIHQLDGLDPVLSDYSLADVLNGNTEWTRSEIFEFMHWFKTEGALDRCKRIYQSISYKMDHLLDTFNGLNAAPHKQDKKGPPRISRNIFEIVGDADPEDLLNE